MCAGTMGLSLKLQSLFRPLVAKAWRAYCGRNPQFNQYNIAQMDKWYRSVLGETLSINSTSQIRRDDHKRIDVLLCVFAVISGDEQEIDYWSRAEERRMHYLIGQRLAEISRAEGFTADWAYVRSMWDHMHLPLTIQEAPVSVLWKVFQALDTHVRRLANRNHGNKVRHIA